MLTCFMQRFRYLHARPDGDSDGYVLCLHMSVRRHPPLIEMKPCRAGEKSRLPRIPQDSRWKLTGSLAGGQEGGPARSEVSLPCCGSEKGSALDPSFICIALSADQLTVTFTVFHMPLTVWT